MLGFFKFVRVQKLPALAVALRSTKRLRWPLPSARHAGWIGRLDGASTSQRQYPSFVIEEPSRASQQTHAYDELRRPRPLDIILTVVGGCSSGAHGEHCGEWKCVETYVLCDLDLLGLPIVGSW